MRVPVPPRELINTPCPKREPTSVHQALRRHLAVGIAEACDLLLELLDGPRAPLVPHAAHAHARVGVRLRPPLGGAPYPSRLGTRRVESRVVVRLVPQDVARRVGPCRQSGQCLPVIGNSGRRQIGRQREPNGGDGGDQRPLPAVEPAMPARLGPVGCGIARRVRHEAGVAVLLVPDATTRPQDGTVEGRGTPAPGPRLEQGAQRPAEPPNLRREGGRDGLEASIPGAPGRKAPISGQQGAPGVHLRRRLREDASQGMDGVQMPDDHPHQRVQKQTIRGDQWATASRRCRRRWDRSPINHLDQRDKQRVVFYHRDGLRVSDGVATTRMRRWPRDGQTLARPFN